MLFALALVLAAVPDAGVAPSVMVDGDGLTATSFTLEQLKKLGPVSVEWKDKTGAHRFTGVRVEKLLMQAGFTEKARHEELRASLIAIATDGFAAVFSVGEVLEAIGPSNVILAWEQDGKPLPAEHGVFRLVVPTDKRGARSIYQLVRIRLSNAR